LKITPLNFNVDVLTLVVNSIIGIYQLERIGTGGVQTNLSSTDIKEILVPIIDDHIQEKIAAPCRRKFQVKKAIGTTVRNRQTRGRNCH
jgi:type I restriction enzyme, S subunit